MTMKKTVLRYEWRMILILATLTVGACDAINDNANKTDVHNYASLGTSLTAAEVQKLVASDGDARDSFGFSVSVSGDTALIGASLDNDNGSDSGSAYVFTFDGTTWTEQAKLLASDGNINDKFGISVSLSGNTALIGAFLDSDVDNHIGSAYVFVRNSTTGIWMQQAKLLASDGAFFDEFGRSVSLSGDTALIGNLADPGPGAAYVFVRSGTTWTEQAKLVASGDPTGSVFGRSVSLSGDTALIGAFFDSDKGSVAGAAYVFVRSGTTWTEQAKLLASDGAAGDHFGSSVSLSGDTALIGAELDDDNGDASGSAYVFTRSGTTWTEQDKLLASDGAADDQFGSVSVSGDTALIGAIVDDDNGDDSGSAYVFTRDGTTWTEQAKVLASDGAAGDVFGVSVSVSGDTALIGASGDDVTFDDSGSAYVFSLLRGILVAPLSQDFGQVDAFTSQDAIVTISNGGGTNLEVTSVAITAGAASFSITNFDPSVVPPFTLMPGEDVFVTITFFPTADGVHNGTLTVDSDDPDNPIVEVSLIGNGLVGAVEDQATNLETAIDDAIALGTLVGSGSGNSSGGRLGAFANMIEAAGDLIEAGLIDEACGQLRSALRRVDGDPRPPDFVTGEEAALIAAEIEFLLQSLGCS